MKLSIVTLVSRPENLPEIHRCILQSFHQIDKDKFDYEWLLLPDPRRVAFIENFQGLNSRVVHTDPREIDPDPDYFAAGYLRNKAINTIPDDNWIYFLDDDNIVDENFGGNVWRLLSMVKGKRAFMLTQQLRDGRVRLRAKPCNARLYHADMAQLVIHHSLIKDYRFRENCRTEDGYLIEQIHGDHPEEFVFIKEPSVYFNYLGPETRGSLWARPVFVVKRFLRDWRLLNKRIDYEFVITHPGWDKQPQKSIHQIEKEYKRIQGV